jgi:outer membrane protein OmpA-like peptidoglycan-associated protein
MKTNKFSWIYAAAFVGVLSSCGRSPEDPGTEYAPQMYISKAYEPFSQVAGKDGKNTINPMGTNMRTPPKNTIARRRYSVMSADGKRDIMAYAIHKDSIGVAEKTLTNPFEPTDEVMAEGQVLYTRFCAHCHGDDGGGQGKVNAQYKGVANISATGALKNMNGGHIYHVITHGKGRMWAHSSLVNPDERWKIVWYVHKLQGQDVSGTANKPLELKAEKGATFVLNAVLFKSGSSDLEESSKKELMRVIEFMKKNTQVKGEIDGHTDNQGDKAANQKVSEARAKAVADFLEANGIATDRVDYKGLGDTQPKASNDDEKGRAKNRRIEFKVL